MSNTKDIGGYQYLVVSMATTSQELIPLYSFHLLDSVSIPAYPTIASHRHSRQSTTYEHKQYTIGTF